MFFLKPSFLFIYQLWSRFSLQALRSAAGLSATIGARSSSAVPCGSKIQTATPLIGYNPPLPRPRQFWALPLFAMAGILLFSAWVSAQPLQTATDTVTLGDAKIRFARTNAGLQPGVQFLHVHENEATAVTAAKAMLSKAKKGSFVTWQCQQDRYVQFKLSGQTFKFDPNRIYTDAGAAATLDINGPLTPQALTALRAVAQGFTTQYVDGMKLVVALHNNTDGGGLSIDSYRSGGNESANTKLVHRSKNWDPDDFFYTTSQQIYDYFSQRNFNIVLQDNNKVVDDGSLSVYAGKKGIHYLNVEAQHGHQKQQGKMLDAVQKLILAQYQ
jgi:hypothetical protein